MGGCKFPKPTIENCSNDCYVLKKNVDFEYNSVEEWSNLDLYKI